MGEEVGRDEQCLAGVLFQLGSYRRAWLRLSCLDFLGAVLRVEKRYVQASDHQLLDSPCA